MDIVRLMNILRHRVKRIYPEKDPLYHIGLDLDNESYDVCSEYEEMVDKLASLYKVDKNALRSVMEDIFMNDEFSVKRLLSLYKERKCLYKNMNSGNLQVKLYVPDLAPFTMFDAMTIEPITVVYFDVLDLLELRLAWENKMTMLVLDSVVLPNTNVFEKIYDLISYLITR